MTMSFREMNLRIFQGLPVPHVLFQPRMEPWFDWHRLFGQMPEEYQQLDLCGFYDACDASMRTFQYYSGIASPIEVHYESDVVWHLKEQGGRRIRVFETPHGALREISHLTTDQTWRVVEFPVRSAEDLRALNWLFCRTRYSFSRQIYEVGSRWIGDRGQPGFWVPKSPYQALAQQWMKLQDLVYALSDVPELVMQVMDSIDRSYDGLYQEIVASGMVHIINFGENLHDSLFSPRWFQRYLLPWYQKRAGELKAGGIYSHMHLDGFFHSLLPVLKDMPFDGLEALTPEPQGDVSLEEMREALGDKILVDGIPAVLFTSSYSREELMATTERIVELFHPRLVLGVSDEVPEGTGAEAIERVKMVAQWARQHG
ncbi:MAG: hypothetical protein ACOX2L_09715 [Anaerolineae bacterium]|nr:hypothetical protein [Chloroflexota bacterium]